MHASSPSRRARRRIAPIVPVTFLPVLLALVATSCGAHSSPTDPGSPGVAPSDPSAIVEPACANPAPLLGHYDPRVPEYIVLFRAGADATSTARELAQKYGFQLDSVYEATLSGFSAELTPEVVADLRCELVVESVEHDSVVKAY